MKKMILALMILVPMGLAAQKTTFEDLLSKYEDQEGFTCVNLGSDMIAAATDMAFTADVEAEGEDEGETIEAKAKVQEAVKDISSMKVITTEKPTAEFRKDVEKMVKDGNYESILSLNEGGDKVGIYVSKNDMGKGDDEVKEMLIVVSDSDGEDVVVSIIGKGDPMEMIKNVKMN